jgi:hypothetical protein
MESTHVRPLAPNLSLSSLERAVPLIRASPFFLFPGGTCRLRATLPGAAGPPACGGLGNRGAAHASLCMGREHGGTQAVSRRSGSPREAESEGPKVQLLPSPGNVARSLQVLPSGRPREGRIDPHLLEVIMQARLVTLVERAEVDGSPRARQSVRYGWVHARLACFVALCHPALCPRRVPFDRRIR